MTVEYDWLKGRYDRSWGLLADLVRRQVAVIATLGTLPTQTTKAATMTIPIVFPVCEDPVELGLAGSIAKPGGNVTGINILTSEIVGKRLRLLRDLLPNAVRTAVLVDLGNASITKTTIQDVIAAFLEGLKESGYVEGQNVALEYRFAESQFDRFPALSSDLVRLQVAVLFVPLTLGRLPQSKRP